LTHLPIFLIPHFLRKSIVLDCSDGGGTAMKAARITNPRVLIVTPETTYLPRGMGKIADYLSAKAGGLADVSAALIAALFEQGADVHVAIPDYRALFNTRLPPPLQRGINTIRNRLPEERMHLAQDRSFFYLNKVYTDYRWENTKIAIAFQREVINNIIPAVQPDLIHCHDWMTGLIPAMARHFGIPCLFTVHNIHTAKSVLCAIEDHGIDSAEFWQNLYFEWMPTTYEQIRDFYPVDFLASGIFAAHFVNTVSPTFLMEVVRGRHPFVPRHIQQELANKVEAECAGGILNAPDPSYDPLRDSSIGFQFGPKNHGVEKRANKRIFQKQLGLIQDDKAPLFFWPSRLDPMQKGCQLLAEILYEVISKYWSQHLQIVFVADGKFKQIIRNIVDFHGFHNRVALCDYDEKLARLAYAASDFILIPSSFEPCGLPQMIGMRYGSIPIAYDTGGLHDTIQHIDVEHNTGNGFLFKVHDANGLFWAIDQAMNFYNFPSKAKEKCIERIMKQSAEMCNHAATARQYIALYEKMLKRPLVYSAEQVSLSTNEKSNKIGAAAIGNLTRRSNDFIYGNVHRLASAFSQIKNQQRKEVLRRWLKQIKGQINASLRMRL
jgi:starch synthase